MRDTTLGGTAPSGPVVLETIVGTRTALADRPNIVLVPTMGALHDGHLALIEHARDAGATVVVSIFVNPLQFGAGEDLDRYPRTLGTDLEKLAAAGVDFVFAPTVEEMYPLKAAETRVVAGAVGGRFEGAARPGHFDGVLTVVAKLLNIVRPAVVVFGQKDAQQVFLVRRMVEDLNIPVRVDVVDTVRDGSGLALSSRNRFLDGSEAEAALSLSRALAAAAASADHGVVAALTAARELIDAESRVTLDYLAIVDAHSFSEVADDFRGVALVLVAARVGSTRLIDNRRVSFER